jgi:hypothetical protein
VKITIIRKHGEPLVVEGTIGTKGTEGDDGIYLEISDGSSFPYARIEMTGADAVEIGAWGMTWLADELRRRSDAS